MSHDHDLVVIGLGSAGSAAARYAARDLGLRVVGVERHQIGGADAWTGSLPFAALRAAARAAHSARTAGHLGIGTGPVEVDLAAVWARIGDVRSTVAAAAHDPASYRADGVELVHGHGRITGAREVTVDTPDGSRVLSTRYILVCTGSRPAVPAVVERSDVDHMTTDQLFDLGQPPSSVAIVGSDSVAIESAQALNRLGVTTTLLAPTGRLLPADEPELADRLATILRDEGVDLHLGAPLTELRSGADGVTVQAADVRTTADSLLVATGRSANVERLGLETFGITTGPSGIAVDGRSRTIVPTIYAVGSLVAERPRDTHAAVHDATVAVRDMFLPGRGLAVRLVPTCTFTDPGLARVGMTATGARERYGSRHVEVHRHELSDDLRAHADGRRAGALVLVTAKDRLVGAHALSPSAAEIIHESALAIGMGLKLTDLADTVHITPSYAAGISRIVDERSRQTTRRTRTLVRISRWFG